MLRSFPSFVLCLLLGGLSFTVIAATVRVKGHDGMNSYLEHLSARGV